MPRSSAPARRPTRRADLTASNPNHHLWQHGKNWWVYCAVNPTPRTKDKLRRSLCTVDLKTARFRRDELFRRLQAVGLLGRMRALPKSDSASRRAAELAAPGPNWKHCVDIALAAAMALSPPHKPLPTPVVGVGKRRLQLCYS